MRAERNRRRLPPRGALSRWMRRITGLLATAAFLGVGVASYEMIAPDESTPESAALVATPTAAPAHHHRAKHHKHERRGLTKKQKAVRASAVAELRSQGFVPLQTSDYDARSTLRVLIGRPVGDAGGGSFAFFFAGRRYLGRDALSPSARLEVIGQTKHSVVLAYHTCCPAERVPVRFKLESGRVQASAPIPATYLRAVRR